MAEIIGFRGVRYDTSRTEGPLTALVAPPYDIISPAEQDKLYAQNPYNVIRLILGREDDKYQSAARLFRQWLADGVLVKEDSDALYVYRQSFLDPSTNAPCPERVGLVCLLKLEEYEAGTVLPHENTLTKAKADRLALMQATNAQFEPIFGLYSDPDRSVQSFLGEYDDREQVMERVPDAIGSSHAIERIQDEDALETLQSLLRDKQIFIADGHHRYETALQHRRDVRAARGTAPDTAIPEDYILISLTAFEDEGLLVLPTHRMVHGTAPEKIAALPQAMAQDFFCEAMADDQIEQAIAEKADAGETAIGVILPGGHSFLAAGKKKSQNDLDKTGAFALEHLPVSVLHSLVLEKHLGIDASSLAAGGQVAYTRDSAEAFARVQDGSIQAAFLLGRPAVGEVRDISQAGDKMPQKSTFFFPKLLSGLLMRDLQEGNPDLIRT